MIKLTYWQRNKVSILITPLQLKNILRIANLFIKWKYWSITADRNYFRIFMTSQQLNTLQSMENKSFYEIGGVIWCRV